MSDLWAQSTLYFDAWTYMLVYTTETHSAPHTKSWVCYVTRSTISPTVTTVDMDFNWKKSPFFAPQDIIFLSITYRAIQTLSTKFI